MINCFLKSALTIIFLFSQLAPIPSAQAQDFRLPVPGVMVHLSPAFNPPMLKGIKINPDNPFRFDFILDKGDSKLSNILLKDESTKLIKYFLASLTIPEKDLWVNLSPYEKDRIVPEPFGRTEMGRDLLAEDYMLKQITASLIYPEDAIGKKFWNRVYEESARRFGTTDIPVNTFNKVWIVPEKAVVYENAKAGSAYVVESKLKVMLEQDYLSMQKHNSVLPLALRNDVASVGANIVREIVIPELTKEVNSDRNFSQLRQVYNSLILATWYKKKIKDSILEQVYSNKNKVAGVNIDDPQEKQRIYERYLQAFKKGVFNYIKEEASPIPGVPGKEQGIFPRKYFSGGFDFAMTKAITITPSLPVGEVITNESIVQAGLRDVMQFTQSQYRRPKQTDVLQDIRKWFGPKISQNYVGPLKAGVQQERMALQKLNLQSPGSQQAIDQQMEKTVKTERQAITTILTYTRKLKAVGNETQELREFLDSNSTLYPLIDDIDVGERGLLTTFYLKQMGFPLWAGIAYSNKERNGYQTYTYLLVRLSDGKYYWVDPFARRLTVRQASSSITPEMIVAGQTVDLPGDDPYFRSIFVLPPEDAEAAIWARYLLKAGINFVDVGRYKQENDARMYILLRESLGIYDQLRTSMYPGMPLHPDAQYYYVFGYIFAQEKDYEGAILALQQAVEFNPMFADAWEGLAIASNELAIASNELKQYWKALEYIRKASDLLEQENRRYTLMGISYSKFVFRNRQILRRYRKTEAISIAAISGFRPMERDLPPMQKPKLQRTKSVRSVANDTRRLLLAAPDGAMNAGPGQLQKHFDNGGIDLTSDKALSIQNNGQSIKFHIDPAMLEQLRDSSGFTPIIINIQPMINLRQFLGIDEAQVL